MKQNGFSIRTSVILCLLLSIIPVDILFIVFSNHAIRSNYDKIEASYRMSIDNTVIDFENLFVSIENDLANMYLSNLNVRYLKDTADRVLLHHYRYTLMHDISQTINNEAGISFVYAKGEFQFSVGANVTTAEKADYSTFFNCLGEQTSFDTAGWYLTFASGDCFLVRILGNNDVYIGKAVFVNENLVNRAVAITDEQVLFFSDEYNRPVTDNQNINADSLISLDEGANTMFFLYPAESYFMVEHSFSVIPVNLICAIPANTFVADIRASQLMFLGLLFLSFFFVIIMLLFIHRHVTVPLNNLRGNILSLQNSNYEVRSGDGSAREIQQVYDTFNNMTDQIKELRIKTYEDEILTQKYQLQYYQLQLKPHFYLNSLKSLYGLAESGKTEDIQKMLLSLSEQFKYIAYDLTTMIPLRSELTRVRNYVNILKMGKGFPVHIKLSVESGLGAREVPSLILQTFIENSIKYAPVMGRTLDISVLIYLERMDEKAYMHITVADNGVGYPEELLQDFYEESGEKIKGHIGLDNLKERLKLIYGGDAFFVISNKNGAVSEIFLPITETEGITGDDSAG